MTRRAILAIFGLLAMTWALVAAVPRVAQAQTTVPRFAQAQAIASECTCGPGTFKCTYDDGSCTCLALGEKCKESETELEQ